MYKEVGKCVESISYIRGKPGLADNTKNKTGGERGKSHLEADRKNRSHIYTQLLIPWRCLYLKTGVFTCSCTCSPVFASFSLTLNSIYLYFFLKFSLI